MRTLRRTWWTLLFVPALTLAGAAGGAIPRMAQIVWVDFDMKDIPEPEERDVSFVEHILEAQFIEQSKQAIDIPRWVRTLANAPKQAMNVNAVGGVPDSSWYTNRHHRHPMSAEELARGPNSVESIDLTGAVITGAKVEGVTPGLEVEDSNGVGYLVKFDLEDFPQMQSGAEMISTKIMYAAGYNVPENYIAVLDPERLTIGDDVMIPDGKQGERRFEESDLTELLGRVAVRPDGKIRVLASRMLEGTPKGPFAYIGTRDDDPNDIIPHEHRRELRGLRVLASWINHWDLKEQNTLDMYVTEGGRSFLRHYFIDFGSSLGAGQEPTEYYHGREYAFDTSSIFKEIFSLGLYTSASEKRGTLTSPSVGMFTSDDFIPESWKTTVPVMPFKNITSGDAAWAMGVLMAFTESDLEAIAETAEYSDPDDTAYVVETLLERRRIVADYWTGQFEPLDNFELVDRRGVQFLTFRDLAVTAGITDAGDAVYSFRIVVPGAEDARAPERSTNEPAVPLEAGDTGGQAEDGSVEVRIRKGSGGEPIRVFLNPRDPVPDTAIADPAGTRYEIARIRRN